MPAAAELAAFALIDIRPDLLLTGRVFARHMSDDANRRRYLADTRVASRAGIVIEFWTDRYEYAADQRCYYPHQDNACRSAGVAVVAED